jgi:hypothetical protein
MRYAVASDFGDQGRLFFLGCFEARPDLRFVPSTTSEKTTAWRLPHRAAAETLANGPTDLSRCLPPFCARTWFIVELPEPPR